MAMGNIFEQYGIKEVADVQFEALQSNETLGITAGDVVLYLDTLKVSTIETTAEQTEAKGGKGNPPLIIWDFGKEITVTLQDALFSAASQAIMNNAVAESTATSIPIRYTEEVTVGSAGAAVGKTAISSIRFINLTQGLRGTVESGATVALDSTFGSIGDTVKLFYDVNAEANNSSMFTISANSFPGTYKVVGDTFIRNRDGHDYSYQFVIPRAKIGSESTITMEAEGDPTVFDMNLRVLRADDGSMIKFIKYDLDPVEE